MSVYRSKKLAEAIASYIESRLKFRAVLSREKNEPKFPHFAVVQGVEKELERSFAQLLSTPPKDLQGAIEKLTLIVDEVIMESELTSYHIKALRNIIDDLNVLAKK